MASKAVHHCLKDYDLLMNDQQVLIIIWSVAKKLQLIGTPWRWCPQTP